jgi:hypothetical protein
MPEAFPILAADFTGVAAAGATGAYTSALASGVLGTSAAAIGTGLLASKLLAPNPHINIPPPPGAAMIDPAGATAAAQIRQRQSAAGGLDSTITGAGNAPVGATSGAKTLLGT